MNVIILRGIFVASLIALSTGSTAQDVDESALDALDRKTAAVVVREAPGAAELRAAMRRIALSPTDADALADAGNAALALGDANAALNFFTRANAIRPRNARITSGLASATVRTENPFEALRLFDDAVKLGASERAIAADRALAFDLLGNFARAQQDYKLARSASSSEDLIVRQAISLSLSGEKSDADGMLVPLLQRNNPAAWRARAFMLAARGDFRESTKVAQGFMDVRSAQKMERYLRLMPDLTRAQQAAAIHLGHFPASNIGRDSENVRRVAAAIPATQPGGNDSRLIPSGEPLGQKANNDKPAKAAKKRDRKRDREVKVVARTDKPAVTAKPSKADSSGLATDSARNAVAAAKVVSAAVTQSGGLPPPESARPLTTVGFNEPQKPIPNPTASPSGVAWTAGSGGTNTLSNSAPVKTNPVIFSPPTQNPSTAQASPSQAALPQNNIGLTANSPAQIRIEPALPVTTGTSALNTADVPDSASASVPATSRPPAFDLAAIVGSIQIPESEQKPSAVPVDLKRLKPAVKIAVADPVKTAKVDPKAKPDAKAKLDPKAKADAKPKGKSVAAANPSRFWVQIATGEASALGFDYRRLQKKHPALFKGQSGWTSAWGRTDRLLVGPFADVKAQKKWEADFKKAGGDAFGWKSEAGVEVMALKGK